MLDRGEQVDICSQNLEFHSLFYIFLLSGTRSCNRPSKNAPDTSTPQGAILTNNIADSPHQSCPSPPPQCRLPHLINLAGAAATYLLHDDVVLLVDRERAQLAFAEEQLSGGRRHG